MTTSEIENAFDVEINIRQSDIPIKGNVMASGNEDVDREAEELIVKQLDVGDTWAWCDVEVRLTQKCESCGGGSQASAYLSGCSYSGEDDFKGGGYYDDLLDEAASQLGIGCSN
jgi:hypothetical protein